MEIPALIFAVSIALLASFIRSVSGFGYALLATLAAYLLFSGTVSIIAFSSLGMISTDLLLKVAVLLPALFLGNYAGIRVLPKINVSLFRKIVPSLVSVAAVAVIVSVFMEW